MAIKDKFCGITEAAEILGCTTGRVRQLLLKGEIAGEKVASMPNSPWLVDRKSIAKYAEKERTVGRPRLGDSDAS